ncbi:MAG: PAS domain-containing protein [Sulfurimonas sp.]|jgi:PAS domain S-box-containing protein|nr:PAS domain-containing protein [Sulfurimonadaceae bacterium]
MLSEELIISKIMKFNREFDSLSDEQRLEWVEEMGDIDVEHFFRANQRVFEEDGHQTRSEERREFFLNLLKNRIKSDPLELEEGHPISIFLAENVHIREICKEIEGCFVKGDSKTYEPTLKLLKKLSGVHIHYLRKEDGLFPYLEKHGFTYPSTGMWRFQDEMRDALKRTIKAFEDGDITQNLAVLLKHTIKDIYDMSTREEKMLFPTAMKLLSKKEWQKIAKEQREIGFVFIPNPPKMSSEPKDKKELLEGFIPLHDGALNIEQLELFFSYLPLDVTIVDENDRVAFFNKGDERTFLRSAGVIGREVKFCHPPKSVHMVLEILEAFKNGSRDSAEFWINFHSRLIHIRYFALRDEAKNYKGVMEITQDITDIKHINGERRLLEWS